MMNETKQSESYNNFLNKLEEESAFHWNPNGSSHRYKMVQLAIKTVRNSDLELTLTDFVRGTDHARKAVQRTLGNIDFDMIEETMETLRVVARHSHLQSLRHANTEAKNHVEKVLGSMRKFTLKQ